MPDKIAARIAQALVRAAIVPDLHKALTLVDSDCDGEGKRTPYLIVSSPEFDWKRVGNRITNLPIEKFLKQTKKGMESVPSKI